jgi:hypothetical protein
MTCAECGAALLGDETCQDRFYALLGAESHNAELARMHGLTVLTYHLQHPSLTKPWYQEAGYNVMRRSFGAGRDWREVLEEGRTYLHSAAFQQWKRDYGTILSPEIVTGPIPGELTVAAVDPTAPGGQADQVLAWARSVAENRVLAAHKATQGP